jgi:hypothetical protein
MCWCADDCVSKFKGWRADERVGALKVGLLMIVWCVGVLLDDD